jgi:hypothetical protein
MANFRGAGNIPASTLQYFKDSEHYKFYLTFEIANKVENFWFQLNVKVKISVFLQKNYNKIILIRQR